jgi:peptidoglycan/LPS O-acetylase OafA/YrhL
VESVLDIHQHYAVAVLGFLCTLVVASASFYLIEKTFIRFGKSGPRQSARVEPADGLAEKSASESGRVPASV